jgi:hypothetical protein
MNAPVTLMNAVVRPMGAVVRPMGAVVKLMNAVVKLMNAVVKLMSAVVKLMNAVVKLLSAVVRLMNAVVKLLGALVRLTDAVVRLMSALVKLMNALMKRMNRFVLIMIHLPATGGPPGAILSHARPQVRHLLPTLSRQHRAPPWDDAVRQSRAEGAGPRRQGQTAPEEHPSTSSLGRSLSLVSLGTNTWLVAD